MNASLRIAVTAAWSIVAVGSAHAQSPRCERTCLEGMVSTYLTALAAHDPGRLPTTPGVGVRGVIDTNGAQPSVPLPTVPVPAVSVPSVPMPSVSPLGSLPMGMASVP